MKYVFVFHKMLSDEEYNLDIYMSNMLNVIFDFDLNNSKTPLKYYCHKTGDLFTFPRHTIDIFGDIRNEKDELLSTGQSHYYVSGITDDDSEYHKIYTHRAICSTFFGKPYDDFTSDHINRDPKYNCLWNLRWLSREDQNRNRTIHKSRIDSCPIIGTHISSGETISFDSTLDATIKNFDTGNISKCLNKKQKTHKNYIWSCPPSLPDLPNEEWKLLRESKIYKIWIGNMNRLTVEFCHGYMKKIFSYDLSTSKGYPRIDDGGRSIKFHNAVWKLFRGPIPDDMIINHIDHNPLNNSLDNLEITDYSGNGFAAHDAGCFDGSKRQRQAIQIDGIKYTSPMDAARKLNPMITDRKEIDKISGKYRKRVKSPNYPTYTFV